MALAPTAQTNAIARAAAPQAGQNDASKVSSDFETFLKMLTVQLQNQDPLNPVEATDYAVQLATFSGVEQQVKSNELLSALGDQMKLMGLGQFASWVGMEARHSGVTRFNGTNIEVEVTPTQGADRAQLLVYDASDTILARIDIPPESSQVTWSGLDQNSKTLPKGSYRFEVESFTGTQSIGKTEAQVYSRITEAKSSDEEIKLGLAGGQVIDPATVTGLRTPGG